MGVDDAASMDPASIVTGAIRGDPAMRALLIDGLSTQPVQVALFGVSVGSELAMRRLDQVEAAAGPYAAALASMGEARPRFDLLWSLVLPIADYLLHLAQTLGRPPVLGIVGGPGAGKTTLALALKACVDVFSPQTARTLVLSLEDFYLSTEDRAARGVKWRAMPGSHDLGQLSRVMSAISGWARNIVVPRYDMRADRKRADDVVESFGFCIVEGWLVGSSDARYADVGAAVDFLLFLEAAPGDLKQWRFEREAHIRQSSDLREGFSAEYLENFWDQVLGPGIEKWVHPAAENAHVCIRLGPERTVLEASRTARVVRPRECRAEDRKAHRRAAGGRGPCDRDGAGRYHPQQTSEG